MPKFLVHTMWMMSGYSVVEAASEDEAKRIASEADEPPRAQELVKDSMRIVEVCAEN